jgi:hypothetical protein
MLSDGSIDEVRLGLVRITEEGDIGFHRGCGLERKLVFGEAAQDGLAADYEDVRITGDPRRGPQDMLKLLTGHAACSRRQ